MSASGALVRNRRDCARRPLQPPGKTAAPDHGFIRAAAGAACMRTLPWAPPAPLCISMIHLSSASSRAVGCNGAFAGILRRSSSRSPCDFPSRHPAAELCSSPPALHQADPLSTHASRPRAETYAAPFRPPTTGALHSALHVLRLSPSARSFAPETRSRRKLVVVVFCLWPPVCCS